MIQEGADTEVSGHFLKALVQKVLLFGEEMWVLTPRIERALNRQKRSWDYPPLSEAMAEAGFEDSRTYVTRRQNNVAQYILTQPIMDLCAWSAQRPGGWVSWRWWEKYGLDLVRDM